MKTTPRDDKDEQQQQRSTWTTSSIADIYSMMHCRRKAFVFF
jgi:hypothetical protein